MRLTLEVSADTIQELKQRAFEALGITEPAQAELPLLPIVSESIGANHPLATPVKKAPKTSKPKTVAAPVSEPVTLSDGEEAAYIESKQPEALAETANPVAAAAVKGAKVIDPESPLRDHEELLKANKALLSSVIDAKGMDVGISVVKNFGVKTVLDLKVKNIAAFEFACASVLA